MARPKPSLSSNTPSADLDIVWHWRPVQLEEAPVFLQVSVETFRAAFGDVYAEKVADYEAYIAATYTLENLQAVLADPSQSVYWLLAGTEKAGFIRTGQNPLLSCLPDKPLLEIKRFYLYPAYHGKGGASWLMDQVGAKARVEGCVGLWLIVAEASVRALSFYEKWGFRQVGNAPFRMGDMIEQDRVMLHEWAD